MATFRKGILGAFYGKVGTIIGTTWRGKDVMRSLPRKSGKQASLLQKMQRERFTLVSNFLLPISSIVGNYFGNKNSLTTQRNQCMSYLIKEAALHDGTQAYWDFTKILITRGDLLGLNAPSGVAGTNQNLTISWVNNSNQGDAQATDLVLAVVYQESSDLTWFAEGIANRDTESVTLTLPNYWTASPVHVWIAVVAANGSKYATSQYLGEIPLN